MMPLWLDANVLLRFLTKDPPLLAAQALQLMEAAKAGEVVLRLSPIVVAETVWVLGSFYGYAKVEIANALVPLLTAQGLETEDNEILTPALFSMAEKNVSFIDAFLAETARVRGDGVASFDRDFDRLGVSRVEPGKL